MAYLVGIDVGQRSVRTAVLRTGYHRIAVDSMIECSLADHASIEDAIRASIPAAIGRTESISVSFEGDRIFTRLIELPATAQRQLKEVLPFELEAQLPFELDQMVHDDRLFPRGSSTDPIQVFSVVARIDDVRERIEQVRAAVGHEPTRVEPGALALANLVALAPDLAADGPVAVAHLDSDLTDVLVLQSGQPRFARTISGGTGSLPASAPALARDLRQTLLAWQATGSPPPSALVLTGPGVTLSHADTYLSSQLELPVTRLSLAGLDGVPWGTDDLTSCHVRAIALALGLTSKARGFNLRQGPLAYERGYGFLREKVPVLAGLGALIVVSFAFATWSEMNTLSADKEKLEDGLATVTKSVFGEPVRDPQRAQDMLGPAASGADDDPMPHMDAFDLMVQLSKAVAAEVTHDVEELDVQRGHAIINAVVPTIPDAQQIATNLKSIGCFKNVKVVRTTQAVNENRQKYVLELDIKCPGEGTDKDKKATPAEVSSADTVEKATGDTK